jgi:hypothetical protein
VYVSSSESGLPNPSPPPRGSPLNQRVGESQLPRLEKKLSTLPTPCMQVNRGDHCDHRVGRVLSFFLQSLELGLPNPSPAGECAPLPLVPWGGAHTLAREGVGEFQFQRGDITVVLFIYIYVLCDCDHAGKQRRPL